MSSQRSSSSVNKAKKRRPRRTVAEGMSLPNNPSDNQSSSQMSASAKILEALSRAQKGKSATPGPTPRTDPQLKHKAAISASKPKTVLEFCTSTPSVNKLPSSASSCRSGKGYPTSNSRNRHNSASASFMDSQPCSSSRQTYARRGISESAKIPHDVLDDVLFRFVSNIPDIVKFDNIRLCFQIEQAHWFYVDFYCKHATRKDCKNMGFREFTRQLFAYSEELRYQVPNVDEIIDEWREYKSSVPTYGAILLDSTLNKVLLVQGFYASSNSWGFPKGKVNEKEKPRNCAIREVLEETGYDFSQTSSDEHKIQRFINDTMVRLYVVTDVPTDFKFKPQTRNEIRKIEWFDVWSLPSDRNERRDKNNFYTVVPFVNELHSYIKKEQERRVKKNVRNAQKQPSTSANSTSVQSIFAQCEDSKSKPQTPVASSSATASKQSARTPGPLANDNFTKAEQELPAHISISSLFSHIMQDQENKKPLATPTSNFDPLTSTSPLSLAQQPLLASGHTSLLEFAFGDSSSGLSPFRPVDSVPVQVHHERDPSHHKTPTLAYPIPIVPEPALPSGLSGMKERTASLNKISASETSAFTAIPNNRSHDSIMFGDHDFELELQHVNQTDRGSSRTSVLSSALEFTAIRSHPFDEIRVQPCEAWNNFKLNTKGIFDSFAVSRRASVRSTS